MSGQKWRLILTVALIALGCLAFYNTFNLWTMSDAEKAEMQENDPGELLKLQQ